MASLAGLASRLAPDTSGRRGLIAVLACIGCALLLTDFRYVPSAPVVAGEVATRDIVAPFAFTFEDDAATADRQAAAVDAVAPVYVHDVELVRRLENRVSQAFDMGRRRTAAAKLLAQEEGRRDVAPEALGAIEGDFVRALDADIPAADVEVLAAHGFSPALEALAIELFQAGTRRPIIADRSLLPSPARTIAVVTGDGSATDEQRVEDVTTLRTPEEARQAIALVLVERFSAGRDGVQLKAAAAIARALVRPTLAPDAAATAARQATAREAVGRVTQDVRRGAVIVRAGDVVDAKAERLVRVLQVQSGRISPAWRVAAWAGLVAIVIFSTYSFARATIRKFSTKTTNLEAMAFTLLLVLLLARLAVTSGSAMDLRLGVTTGSLALLAPVAGGAMLIRILVNSETALAWSIPASVAAAGMADHGAFTVAYHLVTSAVAAAGVGQARERLVVLRAGAQAGLVGAALVVVASLVRAQALGGGPEIGGWVGVAGLAGAAIGAGILCAALALGAVPAFELFGFVTDYKLLELSNLDHPLLKQLMLRAPGTYHHSVIVGSLSEAACERIGANALLARVACYFHDIGKGLKPHYFVENHREGPGRHERLSPAQSAQVIINHVRDGAVLARQYKLPAPIYDNIFMHHGTGLIQFFYARAKEQADAPVDEALFRYPGPKPNTREAGIIMLADKVEAACRTIREPTEERIRAMIQAVVNSVLVDGQFEDCPLTLRELYAVADTFAQVLLGIYHHRIEYPDTKAISSGASPPGRFVPVPRQGTITLEIANPMTAPNPAAGSADYESVEALPGGGPPADVDDS